MTVRDIIAEPLEVMRITNSRQETDDRVRDIASKCRLNLEHLRRFPHAFSGGQRQRVAIARAIVSNPSIILADEPTGNLDSKTGSEILTLFHQLHDAGRTIIMVTHDDEVAGHCSRQIKMQDGQIQEER